MITLKDANKILKDYGTNPKGEPLFRIVWSSEQFEYRKGIFDEFIKGTNIYLRTVEDTIKTKKYPNSNERWILEKWFPPQNIPELPENVNGGYESIYVFQDKNGKFLPLDEEIITFIVSALTKNTEYLKDKYALEEM